MYVSILEELQSLKRKSIGLHRMKEKSFIFILIVIMTFSCLHKKRNDKDLAYSGNPIFPGWYADPEGIVFKDEYWVFPTYSTAYEDQVFFDAFSSKDLIS